MDKNYINYVKDEEILKIINSVGLEPLEDNYDDNGELIPWIERGDNVIMVRAKNTEDKYADIRASAAQCKKFIPFLALATTLGSIYSNNEIVIFKNFDVNILGIEEELTEQDINIYKNYIKFMHKKFGEEYAKDFNDYTEKIKNGEDEITK